MGTVIISLQLFTLLLLLVIATQHVSDVSSLENSSATYNNEGAETCTSTECIMLSGQISRRLNASEDPCNDFYNYACGNFKNVVKYDPDANFHDLNGNIMTTQSDQMKKRQKQNIYEMLILDRVATSNDTDVSELYGLARNLYRSCRLWCSKTARNSSQEAKFSAKFLLDTYNYMIRTMHRAAGENKVSMESVLAALIKTGESYLKVSKRENFELNAIYQNDLKFKDVSRVYMQLHLTNTVLQRQREVEKYLVDALNGVIDLNWGDVSSTFAAMLLAMKDVDGAQRKILSCSIDYYQSIGNYKVVKIELRDLDKITACLNPRDPFSWARFFTELLEADTGKQEAFWITVEDVIRVMQYVTYLKSLPVQDLVDWETSEFRFSKEVSWLILDWLQGFSPFFPKSMRNSPMLRRATHLHYLELATNLASSEKSSWLCQNVVVNQLHPIIERMYQKAYHKEDFSDVKRLIKMVKKATLADMMEQDWITPQSKENIARKIELMDESAGIFSARSLKNFYHAALEDYRNVQVNSKASETNFGILMAISALSNERIKFDLMSGKWPLSKVENVFYGESTLLINAQYMIGFNHLAVNMGYMDPPTYHHSYPDYIKLGGIGSTIGHEIGHGFSKEARGFLYLGKEGRLFDTETETGFNERANCVQKQYAKFTLYPGGPHTNSTATVDEDIADLIGISAAARALQILINKGRPMPKLPDLNAKFSQERLLFIQAAQNYCTKAEKGALDSYATIDGKHSFHRLRVMGMAMNSKIFAKAFKCPVNAPMNPKEKCIFW